MCGRFTLRTPTDEWVEKFGVQVDQQLQLPLRFNIAPTDDVATIRQDRKTRRREMVPMRWGLVPFWADDLKIGARMINARSESVATKPAFRRPFRQRRCLVVADGYLEWVTEGKQKQPYYIRLRGEQPFAFAGLWDRWNDLLSCTILTVPANSATCHVHDRMPVILQAADYDRWLDRTVEVADQLVPLLQPYSPESMILDRVSRRVNNVRHDDPGCLAVERTLF